MSLFSIGVGKSSSSSDPSSVWGGQVPYLQALYQNAFNTANGQLGLPGGTGPGGTPSPPPIRPVLNPGHSGTGAMSQYNQQLAQWQAQQGQGGNQVGGQPMTTGGAGLPNITQYSAGLASNLMNQANGQDPYLQQQIGNLGQNIGQFWNQQLLPGIANDASGFGQYGGSRQGIAQGMGAQQALQSFQQGATDLYANNWNNAPARSSSLYNLGMAPYMAQFQPLQAFSSLLGSPTVLGGGGSQSSSNGIFAPIQLGGSGGASGAVP